jgi:hypothetical protein
MYDMFKQLTLDIYVSTWMENLTKVNRNKM